MNSYLFPGQGSQKVGMGESLFNEFCVLTARADEILGYSVEELCLEDPQQLLNQTNYTQPALYIVNALAYLKKIQENDKRPSFIVGHSLGEYNALFAANVFDFETGLKLTKKRGELMSQVCDGAMAAIIGLKIDVIEKILTENNLHNVSIANYNSYTQVVISGKKADIERARALCDQMGAMMVVPLKVSGAFHSKHMALAREQFEEYLREFHFSSPSIPVIANCSARPYPTNDIMTNLSQQITHPVRWTETIEYLLAQGEMQFEEIGPGNVLTGLVRRIKNKQ